MYICWSVSLQCQTLSKLLKSPPSLALQSWGKPGKRREFILIRMNCFSLGSSPSRCQLRGDRGACLFLCVSCALGLKFHCADGTGRDALLVSSQGSDVSSCLCIYHTRTSPSSSSTARPRVHKQTLSPPLCGALFFIIKVTPKGGSLHQKACVSCCSWFVARRPQQAISLHASWPTENLLSAPLLPQTAFTHQVPQTCP